MIDRAEGQRLARLEAQLEVLIKSSEKQEIRLNSVYEAAEQLKGAKWGLLIIASFIGFLINIGFTYFGSFHK